LEQLITVQRDGEAVVRAGQLGGLWLAYGAVAKARQHRPARNHCLWDLDCEGRTAGDSSSPRAGVAHKMFGALRMWLAGKTPSFSSKAAAKC
jgi:hypothetical protein